MPTCKDMLVLRDNTTVRKVSVRFARTGENITGVKMGGERPVSGPMMIKRCFRKHLENNTENVNYGSAAVQKDDGDCGGELLRKMSYSTWTSPKASLAGSRRVKRSSSYSVFEFEPVHKLRLETSRLVRECMLNYLSSERFRTEYAQRCGPPFVIVQMRVLQGCNVLFSGIEPVGSCQAFL